METFARPFGPVGLGSRKVLAKCLTLKARSGSTWLEVASFVWFLQIKKQESEGRAGQALTLDWQFSLGKWLPMFFLLFGKNNFGEHLSCETPTAGKILVQNPNYVKFIRGQNKTTPNHRF